RHGALGLADCGAEVFDELRHLGTGEAQVAVTALPPLGEQARADEQGDVLARGGAADPGMAREFPSGPGAPVEQRQADGDAAAIGEQAGEPGDRLGGLHPSSPFRYAVYGRPGIVRRPPNRLSRTVAACRAL